MSQCTATDRVGRLFTFDPTRPDQYPPPAPTVIDNAPSALTGAASALTSSGASLTGTVNPNGEPTAATFEYGTSFAFGSITAVDSAGSGTSEVPVPATLTGLAPNTTYYYRLVATSAVGDGLGAVRSFKTTGGAPLAPVAVTRPATLVDSSSALLHGEVNPKGQQAAFTFEYGTSTAFGAITTAHGARRRRRARAGQRARHRPRAGHDVLLPRGRVQRDAGRPSARC